MSRPRQEQIARRTVHGQYNYGVRHNLGTRRVPRQHERTISAIYWHIGRSTSRTDFEQQVVEHGYLAPYETKNIQQLYVCMCHLDHDTLRSADHMWIFELYTALNNPIILPYVRDQLNRNYSRMHYTLCRPLRFEEIRNAMAIMSKYTYMIRVSLSLEANIAIVTSNAIPHANHAVIANKEIIDRMEILNSEFAEFTEMATEFVSDLVQLQEDDLSNFFLVPVRSKSQMTYNDVCSRVDEAVGNSMPPAVKFSEYVTCMEKGLCIAYEPQDHGIEKYYITKERLFSGLISNCDSISKCQICSSYKGTERCRSDKCVGLMCDLCYSSSSVSGSCPFCRGNLD